MGETSSKVGWIIFIFVIPLCSSHEDERVYRLIEEVKLEVQKLQQQMNRFEEMFTKDECADGTHTCDVNAVCVEDFVNYKCQCQPGYTGDGFSCQEIDECASGNPCGGQHTICTNTIASYTCKCDKGYHGNGTTCEDVNECLDDLHQCDPHALCINNEGGYNCSCHQDFEGDGYSCHERTCESPFTMIPKVGCLYLEENQEKNWQDARATCQSLGGDLYSALTESHFQLLRDYYTSLRKRTYPWVGVYEGTWLSSRRPVNDQEWEAMQIELTKPNTPICGYLQGRNQFQIMKYYCTESTNYLCQY